MSEKERETSERMPAAASISLRAHLRYHDEVEFYLAIKTPMEEIWRGRLVWDKEERPGLRTPPLLTIRSFEKPSTSPLSRERGETILQVLMDDLWNCGVRPTEARGSAGQLSAVNDHLKDMKKIAGKFLEVKLD